MVCLIENKRVLFTLRRVPCLGRLWDPRWTFGLRSLYELVPDIPDVMGLRALRPDAAAVKVMSVRDSRCIWVVTPDDHVACDYHEIIAT